MNYIRTRTIELMDFGRVLKVIIVIAVIAVIWKVGIPKLRQHSGGEASKTAAQSSCPSAAARASEVWGSGLSRFVNPPYDIDAWSTFRGNVEAKISAAESECGCAEASCEKARAALHDLRSLVSDCDTAIRNGSPPPSDAVQRQEAIDRQIDEAAESLRSGK
jgi:hypothetical protein